MLEASETAPTARFINTVMLSGMTTQVVVVVVRVVQVVVVRVVQVVVRVVQVTRLDFKPCREHRGGSAGFTALLSLVKSRQTWSGCCSPAFVCCCLSEVDEAFHCRNDSYSPLRNTAPSRPFYRLGRQCNEVWLTDAHLEKDDKHLSPVGQRAADLLEETLGSSHRSGHIALGLEHSPQPVTASEPRELVVCLHAPRSFTLKTSACVQWRHCVVCSLSLWGTF
ncbi:hypothetical protein EYF80_064413 [Liparis tanakae]|uniref:Uncharacterized protein n=1 Tax=Liparis tanakae TaxID=230148 RepID=A0A4Z2E9D2_9TELE|nr:hypothetical protein EYF80_064413 [Liparis tanakae]